MVHVVQNELHSVSFFFMTPGPTQSWMKTHRSVQNTITRLLDDDGSLHSSLDLYFGKNGVLQAFAAAAEKASDYLTHHEADLVITDCFLPGVNGESSDLFKINLA